MTEAKVIAAMRRHLESQFLKVCPTCNRAFATLRQYLEITALQGPAMPYDAEAGDWNPVRPMGTATYSNCPCGSTLALTSDGMPLLQLWSLLNWARAETQRRGMTPQELLNYLRQQIVRQVLAEGG
ncbi:MAG: hypothetical protein ABSE62_10990 [Chthoniobacteraceae bacterium]